MKKQISEYLQLLIAVILASIGLKVFLLPNGFLDGGVTGIAILLSEQLKFDISLLLVIISLPFLILAWFTVSKKIVLKSTLSIIALALFIHFENFSPVTDDKLLISIFGGLFLGAGIGLAIRNGSVLDGSEILGVFVNEQFGISIGKTIFLFNVILFSITAVVLSTEVAMYSILTYLVTAKIIDLMIEGFENYVGLTIVSKKSAEIEQNLMEKVGVGLTVYKGSQGYGSRGKQDGINIIHTVINRIDIRRTYRSVDQIDPDAFIIEFDVNNIKGGVLRKYLSKKETKKLSSDLLES
mgnify:FL=1|tara:strand:- start:25012 stop:25899 length:888 start_codon:yes stop_codon:yes gene_type:complete